MGGNEAAVLARNLQSTVDDLIVELQATELFSLEALSDGNAK
jgi:hypothetical protein